ncbi:MAG: hypothetical protein WHT09_01035 [Thermogutta sp.]
MSWRLLREKDAVPTRISSLENEGPGSELREMPEVQAEEEWIIHLAK